MKTRDRDPTRTHGLPPPPAPPARDANPWTVSGGSSSQKDLRGAALGRLRDAISATEQKRFPVRQVPQPKPRRTPVIPLVIFAIAVLAPLGAALRALGGGALADAIGPLLALLFVGFIAIRILRRRRS